MATADIKIEGMSCEGCVKSADANARVTYDPARTGLAQLKRAVERAGYEAP